MHREIASYPSHRFYGGRLLTADSVLCDLPPGCDPLQITDEELATTTHCKRYHYDPAGMFKPVVMHNLLCSMEVVDGSSFSNKNEVRV